MADDERDHDAAGLGTPDDPAGVQHGAGAGPVDQPGPAPSLGTADPQQADVPQTLPDLQLPERPAPGPLVYDPARDDAGVHLGALQRDLGARNGKLATICAPDLPVGALSGTPQSVIKKHSHALLAVAFQAINSAKEVMESPDNQAAQVAASKVAFEMTMKALEMAYGKKVDVAVGVRSQEDLPKWEDVPENVREAIDQLYADHGGEG